MLELHDRFGKNSIFVAPHAKEAAGDNAIPQVLATVASVICGGSVDNGIVQTTRVYHTGANAMERLLSRPLFAGEVQPHGSYVIVDDVTTLGGTIADLASYIQDRSGLVTGILVLVNAGRTKALVPERRDIGLLERRFGHEITEIFGIEPHTLTANEARYLVGFRSIDEIRNRVLKTRQENDLRLRSKRISRDA